MQEEKENAQGLVLALIFVAVTIICVIALVWGILNLNVWATVIGLVAVVAWFFGVLSMTVSLKYLSSICYVADKL